MWQSKSLTGATISGRRHSRESAAGPTSSWSRRMADRREQRCCSKEQPTWEKKTAGGGWIERDTDTEFVGFFTSAKHVGEFRLDLKK